MLRVFVALSVTLWLLIDRKRLLLSLIVDSLITLLVSTFNQVLLCFFEAQGTNRTVALRRNVYVRHLWLFFLQVVIRRRLVERLLDSWQ